ncbi:hypothetical protein WP50_09210 [Lactiplantibacillus plantarum]|nr:hypothetical protein WP50_09210 [Lactiplantibacillus plantarum]
MLLIIPIFVQNLLVFLLENLHHLTTSGEEWNSNVSKVASKTPTVMVSPVRYVFGGLYVVSVTKGKQLVFKKIN